MPVHSVLVKARDNAASDAVWLRPTGRVADPRLKTYAERVTRYGDWLVYSLDRFSSMEAGGFWCGGDRSTRIVVADLDGRTGAFDLVLEAGPVPVRVQLTSEDTRHDVELKPGQRKTVTMPAPRRIAPVVIAVEGRFRAAEAFGTRADRRSLGVFVEIAQPTSDPRREAGSSPPALR